MAYEVTVLEEKDYDTGPLNLNAMEKEHTVRALIRHDGKRKEVAKALGVTERTVYNLIKKHSIEHECK